MFGRKRKDESRWERWEQLVATHGRGSAGLPTLVTVTQVRQRARRGLKGYVTFPPHGGVYAMWIEGFWPGPGTSMVVTGHFWNDVRATHHGEAVYWVDAVHESVDATVPRGWQRHQRRLDRKQNRNRAA